MSQLFIIKLSIVALLVFLANALAADKPFMVTADRADAFEATINDGVEKARATFEDARRRFQTSLNQAAKFFCAVRLADARGRIEQVFVETTSLTPPLKGTISNEVHYVQGYVKGQAITFDVDDVLDWTIKYHDGRVEGNFLATALKNWKKL